MTGGQRPATAGTIRTAFWTVGPNTLPRRTIRNSTQTPRTIASEGSIEDQQLHGNNMKQHALFLRIIMARLNAEFIIGCLGLALGAIRRYLEFEDDLLSFSFAFERCNIAMKHGRPMAVRRFVYHISLALNALKHQVRNIACGTATIPSSAPALISAIFDVGSMPRDFRTNCCAIVVESPIISLLYNQCLWDVGS